MKVFNSKRSRACKIIIPLFAMLILHTCAADKDERNMCALSCTDAIPVGIGAKIKTSVAALSLGCISNGQQPNETSPQLVQFQVVREITNAEGEVVSVEPIPNAAMTPIVRGALGATQTAEALKNDSRFNGIKTPPEEWCTDSCGFFTFEIVPLCLPGVENTITIEARSGAASTEEPIQLIVIDQTEDDDNDGA
ncbi:hypothetical protein N9D31_01490 [Oligoflexaceae bacterium]|nr:hypothetical protein [Oligoflexaceae bacterium]